MEEIPVKEPNSGVLFMKLTVAPLITTPDVSFIIAFTVII